MQEARLFSSGAPVFGSVPTGRAARQLPNSYYLEHPGHGLVPQAIVNIFREAERGNIRRQCDLYDDLVENDCHLRNLLEQRAQAVAGKDWIVQADGAGGDNELAARVLATALFRLPLIAMFQHQLSFNRYGFAATEVEWIRFSHEGRDWTVPGWFHSIPHRWFVVDPETDELRILTADNPIKGEALKPGQWILTRRPGGTLPRAGLMRSAAWPAYFKRNATGDWFIFAQKFGLPVVLVKYGTEETDTGKDVAEEIATNIGNDGVAAVPKQIDIDIKDAGRTGDSSGVHGGLISQCNAEMSKLVNGSTLSNDVSSGGTGSYAQAEVHDSVRWDNVVADAETLQETIRTQLSALFIHYNGLNASPPLLKIRVVRDLEPAKRAQVADVFINQMGGSVSLAQMRQELGFVEPLNGDDELTGPPLIETPAPGVAP